MFFPVREVAGVGKIFTRKELEKYAFEESRAELNRIKGDYLKLTNRLPALIRLEFQKVKLRLL